MACLGPAQLLPAIARWEEVSSRVRSHANAEISVRNININHRPGSCARRFLDAPRSSRRRNEEQQRKKKKEDKERELEVPYERTGQVAIARLK